MGLRPYQRECLNIIDNMEGGSGLVKLPTGTGKTYVFSHIKRKGRVLILSHRDELVKQPEKYYDCSFGIEKGEQHSKGEEVVSASVPSLARRLENFKPDDFDMIITDEAHHATADTYRKIYSYFKPRLHIGFTATPFRADGANLKEIFDKIIYEKDLLWAIKSHYLCNVECIRTEVSYDLRKVPRYKGDFQNKALIEAMDKENINEQIAEAYEQYAKGQTIIFVAGVKQAHHLAEKIDGAVAVDASTPNREELIKDFTERKIKCLINCMIFTEGTDIPLIETVIIARPTNNLALYTQMVGRGLRLYEGKDNLRLIDCVGVSDMDICSAPNLLGLRTGNVPKNRMKFLQGDLLQMPTTLMHQSDNVLSWTLNAKTVNIFAHNAGLDMCDVDWILRPNGDLVRPFKDKMSYIVTAMDEIGNSRIRIMDQQKQIFESEIMPTQIAIEQCADMFGEKYAADQALWKPSIVMWWGGKPATEKQWKIIEKNTSAEDLEELKKKHLTMSQASNIINIIFNHDAFFLPEEIEEYNEKQKCIQEEKNKKRRDEQHKRELEKRKGQPMSVERVE